MPPQTWYVRNGRDIIGPVSSRVLKQFARAGVVTPNSQVSHDQQTWVPASRVKGLLVDDPARVESESWSKSERNTAQSRPPLPSGNATAAWNPQTLALLGMLFTPLWTAVMAALNVRRLGMRQSAAVPIVICVGWIVVDATVSSLVVDSLAVSALFSLATLVVLWTVVLRHQQTVFEEQSANAVRPANWWIPILCGSPLALLVLVSPFIPLEPRDVCLRFIEADDLEEAQQYTTTRLWPVLAALDKFQDSTPDERVAYELLDEADAPPEYGGYLVGYRMIVGTGATGESVEGVFHLFDYGEGWKIDEIYYTSVNGQELTPWAPLSDVYPELGSPPTTTARGSHASARNEPSIWFQLLARFGIMGILKVLGIAVVALGAGISAAFRRKQD